MKALGCCCRCGHCKNLAPHWAEAASELKGKVKLGTLDATVHTVSAGKYNVGVRFPSEGWGGGHGGFYIYGT